MTNPASNSNSLSRTRKAAATSIAPGLSLAVLSHTLLEHVYSMHLHAVRGKGGCGRKRALRVAVEQLARQAARGVAHLLPQPRRAVAVPAGA